LGPMSSLHLEGCYAGVRSPFGKTVLTAPVGVFCMCPIASLEHSLNCTCRGVLQGSDLQFGTEPVTAPVGVFCRCAIASWEQS
jgi:hypothetical protein